MTQRCALLPDEGGGMLLYLESVFLLLRMRLKLLHNFLSMLQGAGLKKLQPFSIRKGCLYHL